VNSEATGGVYQRAGFPFSLICHTNSFEVINYLHAICLKIKVPEKSISKILKNRLLGMLRKSQEKE